MSGTRPIFREASAGGECRICFEGRDAGVLFQPCLCDGSVKYIHVACLDRWRATNHGRAKTHCPNCHFEYRTATWGAVSWMSHPYFVASLTTSIFIFLMAVFLMIGQFLSSTTGGVMYLLEAMFIDDMMEESWKNGDFDELTFQKFDATVTSISLFGVLGYLLSALRGLQTPPFLRDCFCNNRLRVNNHNRNCREHVIVVAIVAIFIGVVSAIYAIYDTMQQYVTNGRDRIQEYVLDVRDLD